MLTVGQPADEEAIQPQLKASFSWLISAHQLLHRHGQTICKRSTPQCAACPLSAGCPSATQFLAASLTIARRRIVARP